MSAELHGAFVWDCDTCGRENFERAIEGDLDEPAMQAEENQIFIEHVATEYEEREDGLMESEYLIERIILAPKFVTCSYCNHTTPTEVYTLDDDED